MIYNQIMIVAKAKPKSTMLPAKIRKILRNLKKGLAEIYGDQLNAVYLFGSFARGEGKLPDSDIDVMIVLNGEFNPREVEKRSSDFVTSLCLQYEVMISWFFSTDTRYAQSRMPFMSKVRKDAISL